MTDSPNSANKATWTSFLKSIATFTGDLSTLTAPSFILSGTSLLEYSSYWGEHPDRLCEIATQKDAEARMLACVKWYTSTLKGSFSARHESSGGEKKPLNPVLGETFHGSWQGTTGTTKLVAEQVSHHPPISAYHIETPNGIVLEGHNGQKSGFSGRTIIVKQIGHAVLKVPVEGQTETYLITFPNLSLEGLFFGSPYAELTDKSYIISSSGWIAENEYSGKGWVSGKKNTIKTRIYEPQNFEQGDKSKYVVEGQWIDRLSLRHHASQHKDGEEVFVDCIKDAPRPIVDEALGEEFESRALWKDVAAALKQQDFEAASRLKSEIEQKQREMRKAEKAEGKTWQRKYFEHREQLEPEVADLMDIVGAKSPGGYWKFR